MRLEIWREMTMRSNSFLLLLLASFGAFSFASQPGVAAASSPLCQNLFQPTFKTNVISVQNFLREFSDDGTVYHGTEIPAAQFFTTHQRIAYSEDDRVIETTGAYGKAIVDAHRSNGDNGVVIPLRFRNLSALRVGKIDGYPVDTATAKTFAEMADKFDVVVIGKPFRQNHSWPDETNQIIVLNSGVLIIPTIREMLEDLDLRLRPRFQTTSLPILIAYKNLWMAASHEDRGRSTPPNIFLGNRVELH